MSSITRPLPTRAQASLSCVLAVLTALVCGALLAAADLVPAPPPVLPLIALVCVGCPMLAAWELPVAIAVLRAGRPAPAAQPDPIEPWAVDDLLRRLEELPETDHPLGL